jgi:hypothetical protein
MGASLAAWYPPENNETQLSREELRRILGDEHFDEEIFQDMAVDNDWITSAEFLLILSEFIDVDTFFVKPPVTEKAPVPGKVAAPTQDAASAKKTQSRFKSSAELVKTLSMVPKDKNGKKPETLRSGLSIAATVTKIRAFFTSKKIVIPQTAMATPIAEVDGPETSTEASNAPKTSTCHTTFYPFI